MAESVQLAVHGRAVDLYLEDHDVPAATLHNASEKDYRDNEGMPIGSHQRL
jgi:hypothetical protein